MTRADHVTVYNFHTFEESSERPTVSTFKTTREAIEQGGGRVLEGTQQTVEREALDSKGRYRRIATGWGELS